RAVVADWNVAEARLTIYQGTQAPHMVQNIAALHLGLAESQVRVVCKDVGGSFGIKVHIYADEMATYALSKLLRRPVKFVADRVESFNTDIHARVVFQNKNVMCQYRAVGHPIACSVTEGLVDLAAMKISMDPVDIRLRNL